MKSQDKGQDKRQDKGRDFASATMMRLVAMGLARQGISVCLPPQSGSRVPISQKRDVLDAVLAEHGPLAVLSIADAAPHMPPEPVVQALTLARDIDDLFDRWHRLERFSHGRNTVETRRIADGCVRLTHRARDGGPPPSCPESLLVLGLLTVLVEMIGAAEVSLVTETGDVWRLDGAWHAPALTPAVGSMLLLAPQSAARACRFDDSPGEDPILEMRRRLVADPVRRWTLAELAAEAGASPRTLQRRLALRSSSFSRLLAEARLEVAASFLCDGRGPGLAEIGFLAGFSDQAHFARTFNRAVGTPPGAYRADFGR
jgi:AraC-like DNA-binding protein